MAGRGKGRRDERRLLDEEDPSTDEELIDDGDHMGTINRVQRQGDDVTDIMRNNLTKVVERGDRLQDLEDKSESLVEGASAFRSGAQRARRKYWWQHVRLTVLMGGIALAILIIIIVSVILRNRGSSTPDD
eukprot:comp22043_c0_seq1/m.32028 comp22043_c0_seq1/g.32028  ORF comp22043_c0_seq1/g.32028 comp22043_c0_seq1/m.32028 type:complete len:131 (-) comp22043_c0_seq1:181-573(-)